MLTVQEPYQMLKQTCNAFGINSMQLAAWISVSQVTITKKLSGKVDWKWEEVLTISNELQKSFGVKMPVEKLFKK